MLQFMHGEEINPSSTTTGLRFVKKAIVFADKDDCGLDLHNSLDLWQQHNRSLMIRCVQALTKPQSKSKMAAWISRAQDVLFASGNSTFIRQLMRNPNVTPMWSVMVSSWFEVRWTPFGLPSNAASLDIPLWHNAFSPGLENLYDQCSSSTRPQALTLALLKINKLYHLLTSCQRVWPASILYEHINAACVRQNLEPPTKQWISILVTKLSASFPIVPAEEAPPFKLPTTSEVWRCVPWMIRPDQEPILLTTVSSKSAKIKTPPSTDLPLIPTRHLNLPDDLETW
ncbi:Aste57867_19581 [Aphanomyces stellatus]|uniref:Aste57867_19581 protein n=1 Tax=Aphanomyces stellatus TaxID=120398 RepID=A0A485LD34_9STRA|nr:hypothetical protein As57867_019517 [Aphanomyces stellatus]VFT96284.1 Aste57867_19581 [Aphanomyces stellatus]